MPGPILIAGDDHVPQRVAEELADMELTVVVLCSHEDAPAARAARARGATPVVGDLREPETWRAAGVGEAAAIGVLGSDDLANLDAGLLVADLAPGALLVLRMFAAGLADGVRRMLGDRARVLSDVDEAAPTFLQAALSGNEGQRVTLAGRVLEVADVDRDDPRLVLALCNPSNPTAVLPPRDEQEATVTALVDPRGSVMTARGALPAALAARRPGARADTGPRRAPRRTRYLALARLIPGRARILAALIVTVAAVSTVVFAVSDHLDPIDAAYFTATTMATVGYGDVNLLGAPDWLKVYDMGLMVVSAVLLASTLALITDLLVTSRIDRALGRFPRPHHDHVVVCGLGKAGAALIAGLHELGVPCIGVERDAEAVGVGVARGLEVPVVLGDARDPGVLARLHLDAARAVMAVTTDDLANVQTGLIARSAGPDVRVVLRIFDPGLAERLDRTVEFDLTRSVSGVAAPAFAAALLGRPSTRPLALSSVPLRVLDATVRPGSPFVGQTVAAVHAVAGVRVVALAGRWLPGENAVISAGDGLAAVGTREATDDLLDV